MQSNMFEQFNKTAMESVMKVGEINMKVFERITEEQMAVASELLEERAEVFVPRQGPGVRCRAVGPLDPSAQSRGARLDPCAARRVERGDGRHHPVQGRVREGEALPEEIRARSEPRLERIEPAVEQAVEQRVRRRESVPGGRRAARRPARGR